MNLTSNIRIIITYLLVLLFVSSWVVTVFWTNLVFPSKVDSYEILSKNIFLWDKKLQSTYIYFSSSSDLSQSQIKSSCNISSKFLIKNENKYLFKLTFLENCIFWYIHLENQEKKIIKNSKIKLNIFTKSKHFDFYVDRSDLWLSTIINNIKNNLSKLNNSKIVGDSFKKLKVKRQIDELTFQKSYINDIINSRKDKYIVPVEWYNISNDHNKIPNAGRPYRNSYTDWIHHWWDVIAPFWEKVISLDYSKVIRIVNGFKFSDLNQIKKNNNLSYEDELNNLDILRWNQVWIKTSKWDVIFYSHLSEINESLKVWDIVNRGTYLWKIWITWIPDRNYTNYHLHFPIHKNPYNKSKVWKYEYLDYMKWDWYFKWKSLEYIRKNQKNIFK